MMHSFWALAAASLLLNGLDSQEYGADYCRGTDDQLYEWFGEWTSYETARNQKLPGKVPKCTPVAIWSFVTNGPTFPELKDTDKYKSLYNMKSAILRNHEEMRSELCWDDFVELQGWTFKFANASMSGRLSSKDRGSISNLGQTFVSRYPEIFKNEDIQEVYIGTSYEENARETEEEFIRGLSRAGSNASIMEQGVLPLITPTSNCTQWEENQKSEKAQEMRNEFRRSSEARKFLHEVSKRLGFNYDLKFDVIEDMYAMCRLDRMFIQDSHSPWCGAFTHDHIKFMEYDEDLYSSYKTGYGNDLSKEVACPLVRNLMESFENITQNVTTPQNYIYFGDVMTLRLLLTRLGISQDNGGHGLKPEPGRYLEKRQWRLSVISPVLSNLVVVLYKCTYGEEYQLMFYLNEHPIEYSGCKVGLCDWSYIYDRFKGIIDPNYCNIGVCHQTGSASLALPSYLMLTILSFFYFK